MNVVALRELSLFSGAGGGLLGTTHLLGWQTVCYVEWDRYCAKVLSARIDDGYLHDAPIWDDVQSFDGRPWRGHVDVISGGFPCQPFSTAGTMGAGADERNGWPDTRRIIRDVRPGLVYLENVPGLLARSHGYFGVVLGDLAALGYDAEWGVLSAADVGAPHKRGRLWVRCVENATSGRLSGSGRAERSEHTKQGQGGKASQPFITDHWTVEPGLGRMAYGVPNRVDRLKAIGNAQVPLVAATAWEKLDE